MSKDNKYRHEKQAAPRQEKMEVVRIISEHKKRNGHQELGYTYTRPAQGMKRVEAICKIAGRRGTFTRHLDVAK